MKRKYFTLIELLVVISIIAILAGLLLPVISKVKDNAKKVKAKSEARGIVIAIKGFESTYGLLPWTATGGKDLCTLDTSGPNTQLSDADYDLLMMTLTQTNTADANCPATPPLPHVAAARCMHSSNPSNTRAIKFLDTPTGFSDTLVETAGNEKGSFRDPWGKRYGIALDLNYDNKITMPAPSNEVLNGSVFVWSFGIKGNNEFGNNTIGDKDDIASWRE